MSTPTKAALALLRRSFNMTLKDGTIARPCCSGIDTDEGTLPLWGQLVLCGYVRQRGASPLGHRFSIDLTEEGKAFLKSESEADQ